MYQERYSDDEFEVDSNQNDFEWEDETPPMGQPPRKSWWHWKPWLFIIVIIAVVGIATITLQQLQSAYTVMPTYLGLNNQLVATVKITTTKKYPLLVANITFFDKDGKSTGYLNCYINQGSALTIGGDNLNFASWLNSIHLHSGYKLSSLQGCSLDANNMSMVYALTPNGSEDGFFIQLEEHPWAFSTASADHSTPLILQLAPLKYNQRSETYNLYTTPDGLKARLVP